MTAAADLPQLIEHGRNYLETGLVHRVKKPQGDGPYPAVVMLHGRYGDENSMWLFEQVLPAHWLKIAPRGVTDEPPDRFSWVHREEGNWPTLEQFDPAVMPFSRFISALPQVYQANPRQIYLMGFSQGAATAYALAMRLPGLVHAIAGLVGFVPEGCEELDCLQALQDMPLFYAVGRNDPLIPMERSLKSADFLRQSGAALTYREYAMGHKLSREAMKDLRNWWRTINS